MGAFLRCCRRPAARAGRCFMSRHAPEHIMAPKRTGDAVSHITRWSKCVFELASSALGFHAPTTFGQAPALFELALPGQARFVATLGSSERGTAQRLCPSHATSAPLAPLQATSFSHFVSFSYWFKIACATLKTYPGSPPCVNTTIECRGCDGELSY